MNNIPEKYRGKPNLWRVAREIAKMDNPELVVSALVQMLATYAGRETPVPMPGTEGNNAKFNAALNGCQHPKAVYNMLLAFAENSKEVAV